MKPRPNASPGSLLIGGVAFLGSALLLAASAAAGPAGRRAVDERGVDRFIWMLEHGSPASLNDLNAARAGLTTHHKRICRELIALIEPARKEKLPEAARAAVAHVLGELRCAEAAEALAAGLGHGPFPEPFFSSGSHFWRFAVCCGIALTRIGRPAVPALIGNLEKPANSKCLYSSLTVLHHVLGGKRRLLELIVKLQKRAADAATLKNLAEARRITQRMPDAPAEPLY